MDNSTAIFKVWESLAEVEHYFKNGIPQQLETAASFSGEDAIPIHNAQLTLKQCIPFLPSNIKENAEDVLQTAFDQFNLFLSALGKVVESNEETQREVATKEANMQLESSLDTYREKLHAFSKIIPQDISSSVVQHINISGIVEGPLNIAGESIHAPNMNITLSELARKIEASKDSGSHEAKSKLKELLKHPLVVKILGSAIGGVIA